MAIARRYRKDHEIDKTTGRARGSEGEYESSDGRKTKLFYGPWMWKQAYSLFRIGRQRNASAAMRELERNLLSGRINDLGLAARWAQWLTRQEN